MTDTEAQGHKIEWESVTPVFAARLRPPKKPARPSDGAIALAQKSLNGEPQADGEIFHVITRRFRTEAEAEAAADELRRAGAYTEPESTVTVVTDPDRSGDKRMLRFRAGGKRGRR